MNKQRKTILFIVLIGIIGLIVGVYVVTRPGNEQDIRNMAAVSPAVTYYVDGGYEYKVITNDDGSQSGVCVFPDGEECSEIDYYNKCVGDADAMGDCSQSCWSDSEDCENLWWFDSDNQTECQEKDFCGSYMYDGLHVFRNQANCITVLEATCMQEWDGKQCLVSGGVCSGGICVVESGSGSVDGDLDGNGKIDMDDFALWVSWYREARAKL